MLCGSVSFALMGVQARAANEYCAWPTIALARSVQPLILALLFARASGARLVFLRPRILWLRSIAGSISLICTFYALTKLPVADVFTITNMFPIWVSVLSWPLLGAAPPGSVWRSVVSGVVGVWLIQEPTLQGVNWAVLPALAASMTTAVAMLGLHRLRYLDTWAIVVHFSAVAFLCALAIFLMYQGVTATIVTDKRAWWLLAGIGLCATVGQFFLTRAFAAGAPGKVSVVALTQVPVALALEVAIWNRPVHFSTAAGILLVLAPTAWLMLRRKNGTPLEV
jgi:drug/metabolite transporter (DMT)-like permease